eukprot:PhM_4_TR16480/c1_g1_i1/m.77326
MRNFTNTSLSTRRATILRVTVAVIAILLLYLSFRPDGSDIDVAAQQQLFGKAIDAQTHRKNLLTNQRHQTNNKKEEKEKEEGEPTDVPTVVAAVKYDVAAEKDNTTPEPEAPVITAHQKHIDVIQQASEDGGKKNDTTPSPEMTWTPWTIAPSAHCKEGFSHKSSTLPTYILCNHGTGDVVSSFFIRDGFWRDCKPLTTLLSMLMKKAHVQFPTVVDVGANIGACAMWLAASNNATVFAFEPMSQNLRMLRSTLEVNGIEKYVHLIPAAASVENSSKTLYSEQGNLGNSVMMSANLSQSNEKEWLKRAPSFLKEPITTRRVDDYVQQHVHLMKLDCQGCEYKAFLGAQRLFEKYGVDVVRAEFDPGLIRAVGDDPRDVLRFLWKHNYVVFDSEKRTEVKPGDEDKFTQEHEGHAVDIVAFAPAVKDLDLASGSDL